MKTVKSFVLIFLVSGVLFSCNKEKHWNTTVTAISYITSYSAQITVDYDFGGKSSKTFVGVDVGRVPDFSKTYNRYVKEEKNDLTISFEESNLYAGQTYYVRSFMVAGKDTVWSETESFTTLNEPNLACSVSAGEVFYTGHGITESVGNLVEIENTADPDLFTYEVTAAIGNLKLTFSSEPQAGKYTTWDEIFDAEDFLNRVELECWFNDGGSPCHYTADPDGEIIVSRDSDSNVSIYFCNLQITKDDTGGCINTQEISGKLTD